MPHLAYTLGPLGAILQVHVGVNNAMAATMQAAKQVIPPPTICNALIDTGASHSCIDPAAVKRIGILPTGEGSVGSATTGAQPVKCNIYTIGLALLHPSGVAKTFGAIEALESEIAHCGYEMLLGRDVLNRCLLIYDGQTGHFTLAI